MRHQDRTRQVVVAASALIAIVGSFVGSGVLFGTPINRAADGALAADATLVAPGTGAFQIWGLIYLGLVAYAVWQFLPAQKEAGRHRRLGYPVALSLLLNAAWILSIQFDLLWLSVPVIAALLVVLVVAFRRAVETRSAGAVDSVVTDGTIGLYLGWVCVATAANITAWLTATGFRGAGIAPEVWTIVIIAVAAAVGIVIATSGRGRLAPMLSLGWGLTWVAVARLGNGLHSTPTAVAAIVAVVIVVLATVALRVKASRGSRPA
nr:tryptophan-rich sensory protein [Frondihabitans sucicola]